MKIASLASMVLALTLILFAQSGQAATPNSAKVSLETSITRILDFIKNPGYTDPGTRGALRSQIETEVRNIFDFEEFSSRTVGAAWRSFSPEQKKAFSDAFADLLLSTYLDKVDGYNGEKIQYTGEVANAAGDRVEVRTAVTLKDNKSIPVAYRMLPKEGKWRVYDVLIEGISLVKNYRTQFEDILSKGTPEQLTARVQERAKSLREKAHEKK